MPTKQRLGRGTKGRNSGFREDTVPFLEVVVRGFLGIHLFQTPARKFQKGQ